MDCRANSDTFFLSEKFDFDVSLSPASSKGDEDEDEVFVGPVTHKERCLSVNKVSQLEGDVRASWSPLSGDQLDSVFQEAHKLAKRLKCSELSQPRCEDDKTTNMTNDTTTYGEEFVQDAEAKLGVLGQTASALSPIKRQTFCVQDSPMKQLPPAVQQRILRGSISNTALSSRYATVNAPSSIRPTARLSTSSPIAGVKPQPRMGLRGKAAMGVVLPSKPAAPTTSCSTSKSRVEKTRLQPPSKAVGGCRRGLSSRAGSSEDLLSDSASVASDISDSSLNSSLLGKRMLAPPTKSAVRNRRSGVKAPPLQKRRVTERKNTSSSSSSVSSFNSSLSVSPAKGKLNSSLNRSLSSSTSCISRPANHSRPRCSSVYDAAETAPCPAGRRSLSVQARKLSEVERVKATKSTPLKRAEATPLKHTPGKMILEKTASVPTSASAQLQSRSRIKSKPEALVLPTPNGGVRGVRQGDDITKMLKPKRLMSVSSVDSLPQKPFVALTPSAGSCRSLQVKARRPSALPTPVKRRMSAMLPVATPTRPPLTPDSHPVPASARRERSCSTASADSQEAEPVDDPDVQPFCLEEEPPAAPPSSPPQADQSESTDPGSLSQGESEPGINLIELESKEDSDNKTPEVLLLDLPAPTLHVREKLLIDLTNTPDLIRTNSKTCTTTQLIDLSSPLIKWSPEDKGENNAPLINLSF
ncbi:hypothetical protein EPR50_G00091770 [Perca flavescens]|uniref:G2 and S phase-expressed protein 1 N-terminal domain-containing protein n=1 Tax=Perca flavescens TaxID=8167 RepID=A0A484D3C2_PERFV|nr:G2 and S phase-expressed protein 1 [Perca flavescens]TDH09859.1 hypothetical protein EPR50_G00091770 [Perca flavescens]